jgi:hypothetical protein
MPKKTKVNRKTKINNLNRHTEEREYGPNMGLVSMRAVFSFWRVILRRFSKRQKIEKRKVVKKK